MPAESLAAHVRSLDAGELHTVVHYDGETYDTVYEAAHVEDAFSETELEEVTKQLVLKSFDDGLEQPEFARFGHLDATVRWFGEAVVFQVPMDDWSGVIVTFDRESISDTSRLVDEILSFVDDELHDEQQAEAVADEFAAEFDQ
jgi:hypothetical protein